jgi:DNA-binding NarL/FixJ family response regulator
MTAMDVIDGLDLTEPEGDARPFCVLVVEPEVLLRTALASLVIGHADIGRVETAATFSEAIDLARALAVDVILCGLFLPDGDACALYEEVTAMAQPPEMVVLTQFATAAAASVCRAVGIRTCLSRDVRPESMVDAVLAAARREPWSGPGAVVPLAQPPLTYLQTQILARVASGDSNDVIARSLGYSANYVKDLIASARAALDARDRAHAASLAVALRLVRPVGEGRFVPALPALEQVEVLPDRRRAKLPMPG